ncbi:hypothetical protein [Bacillus toyonensis]|uniref:phage major capsid protein n=1 Tax=Bacillus toyonensis TaxID=155322 RepID=UPI001C011BE7|nr:hypothetical protein [Bacillus toyonensis]UFH99685.1 hypothetical protein HQN46_0010195 [Bacillus toyonensis]
MADLTLGQHPLLKKQFINARIKELSEPRFVADALMMTVSADALAVKFFKDGESYNSYEEVPEVGEGSGFKRIGLSEDARLEMIRKYGLEFAFSYEMQKWGTAGQFERAFRKLSSSVVNMVNGLVYDRLHESATAGNGNLQNKTGNYWNAPEVGATAGQPLPPNGADNMIADIVNAKKVAKDKGYKLNTMVIGTDVEAALLSSKPVRDALSKNNTDLTLFDGYIGDFLQVSIIVDEHYPADQALLLERKIVGEIADAEPLRATTYNQDEDMTTIGRVTRFTTAYVTDPSALFLIKNVLN